MKVARPDKLSHLETILYEIDMLRYAAFRLRSAQGWDEWVFLECFLLHFRNLIEFFGSDSPNRDNLSIVKAELFWPKGETIPGRQLQKLYQKDLWEKYEGKEKRDKISRFLQHCTEERVKPKDWNVSQMLDDLNPLIEEFEKLLPSKERRWGKLPTGPAGGQLSAGYSTGTITRGFSPFSRND